MAFLERNANRGSISTGYDIDNSMKCQANSGNEWFYRDNPTAGNRQTFTFSFWLKRTQVAGYEADNYLMSQGSNARFHFAGHTLRFMFDGNSTELEAAGKLRDCAAWYHIVLAVDTTQGTNTNRVKAYVNGESYPFNNNDWPSQNATSDWMNTNDMYFNTRDGDGSYDNSGYWAEIAVVDGQQLAPTDFGEYNDDGVWVPKDLSDITWGNEGFWWNFSNSSSLGEDSSGNNNTATFNNLTTADLATDTPTKNFCTLNPLVNFKNGTNGGGMTQGATVYGDDTGGGVGGAFGTFAVTKGKWYWEMKLTQQVAHYPGISAVDDGDNVLASSDPQEINSTFNYNISAARREYVSSGSLTYGSLDEMSDFHSVGDIIGIALNMDDNQISIYGNGTLQSGIANSSIFDAANKMVVPFHGTINDEVQYNFGGYCAYTISSAVSDANGYGTFEYAPPSGYYSLCTKNLAEYG